MRIVSKDLSIEERFPAQRKEELCFSGGRILTGCISEQQKAGSSMAGAVRQR